MPDPSAAPPAIRSSLALADWFLAQAAADRSRLSSQKLQQLMYVAQALFAATQQGRKLIPATFLAAAEGPLEPTVADAVERGLHKTWKVSLAKPLEAMLTALWQQYGSLPATVLMRMIGADGVWRPSFEDNPDGEISTEAMLRGYAAVLSRPAAAVGAVSPADAGAIAESKPGGVATVAAGTPDEPAKPPANRASSAEIRMTRDGRVVTRWAPKRRIEGAG